MAKRALTLALGSLIALGWGAAAGCGLDWNVPPDEGEGGRHSGHASAGPGGLVLPTSDGSSVVTGASSGDASNGAGGAGAGGGGPGSSSTGSLSCDEQGPDCDGCANCSVGGYCYRIYDECVHEYYCFSLQDCLYPCTEQACVDDCWNAWPEGVDLYTLALQCIVCDDCVTTCAAYQADWQC